MSCGLEKPYMQRHNYIATVEIVEIYISNIEYTVDVAGHTCILVQVVV